MTLRYVFFLSTCKSLRNRSCYSSCGTRVVDYLSNSCPNEIDVYMVPLFAKHINACKKTLASILSTRSIVISVLLCCCLLKTLLKSDWFIWCRSGTSSHATVNKEELCRQMILHHHMSFWVVFWNSTQIWSILVLYSSLDRGPFGYLLRRHHNRLPDLRHQRARQQDPAHTRVPAPAAVDRHQRGKYSYTGRSISAGHEHFSKLAIAHLG